MGSKEGALKSRQKMIEKYGSLEAYKEYMRSIAKRSATPESARKGTETKLKNDPLYFKKIGSIGGKSKKS